MEFTYSKNQFGRDDTYSGMQADIIEIVRLIKLNKGENPTLPEAGLGIKQYRFQPMDDPDDIIKEILDELDHQREQYLPHSMYIQVKIAWEEETRSLVFQFDSNDTSLMYDSNNDRIVNTPTIENSDNNS